jgi:hypothetical protein
VVLRNLGAVNLTSVKIHYGILGANNYDYSWAGNLAYNETQTITLPNIILNDSTAGHTFQAYTYLPNGQADNYPYNDTARTYAAFPPVYDSVLVFWLKTNLDPTQNNWWLTNDAGDTLYSNDANSYLPGKLYKDTFHLVPGCYNFTLNDQGGDGLDFNWVNGRGVGSAQFHKPTGALLHTFQPDFGSQIGQSFMVGTPALPAVPSGIADNITTMLFKVYPNPNNGNFLADIIMPGMQTIQIRIYNAIGELINSRTEQDFYSGTLNFDLASYPSGVYFVNLKAKDQNITRRIILQK